MKAFLMHRDQDLVAQPPALSNEADLRQDLELDTLISAMADGDKRIFEVARIALLYPLTTPPEIEYRQAALTDCLANPDAVRELYAFALESLKADRGMWGFFGGGSPETTLSSAQRSLGVLMDNVHDLRVFADDHKSAFASEAFTRLFDMLQAELTDEYFALVKNQLRTVEFKNGTLISAQLGRGNKGTGYVLRLTPEMGWRDKLARFRHPAHGFDIHPRDEGGMKALSELRSVALNDAANALAQSVDHIKSFFSMLGTELAFYVGCLNLHDQLQALGAATCQPEPTAGGATLLTTGLHDVSLTLRLGKPAVGNDINADGKGLIVVTGANQGGKSTFLRSFGAAQLMMQAGMFVGAEAFTADVRDRVFTHYKREEDECMESGKFDEELTRMSAIAQQITARSLFLSNESLASTNEREGSEVARQVVHALREAGVKIVFVTHLFDFADGIQRENRDDVLFLRASRSDDGERPYKLVAEPPLPTSYGQDTYTTIFETV